MRTLASVGTRASYSIVRLPGWYGERVLFITTLSCVVHIRFPISRCHEIDYPLTLTAQSSASYCVNRVRYVSRQFMQNYCDSSAEVYD